MSVQNKTELPLFGVQVGMLLNLGKGFITSFHQKEPTGDLPCGGVWVLEYNFIQVRERPRVCLSYCIICQGALEGVHHSAFQCQ